jgi:hypothetical protein
MNRNHHHLARRLVGPALGVLAAAAVTTTAGAAPLATPLPPPVNTSPPTMQSPPPPTSQSEVTNPQVGRAILGVKGTWTGASFFKVQWEDCDATATVCSPAAGTPSTNTTYKIDQGDVGHYLVFMVTATSSPGSSASASSAPSGLVANGPPLDRLAPTISGLTQDGQTLTSTSGNWDGTLPITYAYQWRRCDGAGLNCGQTFPGTPSNSPTYTLQDIDLGHILVAYVTATNVAGPTSVHSHTTTTVVTPGNTGVPTITGAAQEGKTLTEAHGGWIPKKPASFTYQWQDCDGSGGNCSAIAGATSQTYSPNHADVGHTLRVQESAISNGVSSSPASSNATGAITTAPAGTGGGNGGGGNGGGTNGGGTNGGGTNGGGTTGNNGGSGGSVTVSAAKVRALLRRMLSVHGKAGTIRGVLNHAGYSFGFAAPSSGRLVVAWYFTPKHGRKTLVSEVTLVYHTSGRATAKVVLTSQGRRLLSGARQIQLTATGAFTPTGRHAIRSSKSITLRA